MRAPSIRGCSFAAALFSFISNSSAQVLLSENFDDLPNMLQTGWSVVNNSAPVGDLRWRQGEPGGGANAINAHSGTADSYATTDYESTGNTGTISDWLISPSLLLADGDSIVFWTLSANNTHYPDRLECRLSPTGGQDAGNNEFSVGDFTISLVVVNPLLNTIDYPDVNAGETWQRYAQAILGVGTTPAPCRLAFRYFVTDAGLFGTNSSSIGVDDLMISREAPTAIVATGHGSRFSAWPIPVKGNELQISLPDGPWNIALQDALGRSTSAPIGPFADHATVDTRGLTNGIYILTISSKNEHRTLRFSVSR